MLPFNHLDAPKEETASAKTHPAAAIAIHATRERSTMFSRESPFRFAEQIAAMSSRSPEFWLFNPPATPKDIKRLELRLGRSLPAPLADMLAQFNGGFASFQGKVSIDSGPEVSAARSLSNRFFTVAEIDGAYRRLLAAHPDEDPKEFPFIPFMQLSTGGFLAINANDPHAAVWDAWTLDGPHLWHRLYPSLTALLFDYLGRNGSLIEEPLDGEPAAMAAAY